MRADMGAELLGIKRLGPRRWDLLRDLHFSISHRQAEQRFLIMTSDLLGSHGPHGTWYIHGD